MSCRDVRCLRGDRDGIVIPAQPCVVFFPENLSTNQLEIALNHILASYRINPRPLYLIFENSGRERSLEDLKALARITMPIMNRIKLAFFSPVAFAVYSLGAANSEERL